MNTELLQGNKVAEVIKVLNAGKAFYQHIISQMIDQDIKLVVGKMIKEHELAIHELQTFVMPTSHEIPKDHSLALSIVDTYAQLMEVISFERLHVFVDLLEELENKTLKLIDQAIGLPQPQIYKQYLQRVRVSVQECHDQIRLF